MEQTVRPQESPRPIGLLETKLHPPAERDQLVVRDRLLDALRPDPGLRLAVVAAPAGYGKTTLLGMWRRAEASTEAVAWLAVDEGDNDAVVLWSHVLEALRRVCPGVGLSASPEVVGAAGIVNVVLPQLVNELSEQGDVALILDDFHRLSSGPAANGVAWLVEHAPSTFTLVLGTRSEPALPLAALRAHGALREVRADELGFTSDEAEALLNGRLQLGLAREDIDDLVARSEGWPAGLYLAALSLRGVEDRHELIVRFGGSSRHVVDFLVDEVLSSHDTATQTVMLRSSILKRLCGPLCDAVLEREDSGGLLSELARTNLFLVPLDDRGGWYRFHHLFAQLLRVELEHREPGLAPALHRRAYAWHRDHGSVDEAIEHALEAGAFAEAGEQIEAAWARYAHVARYATVLGWLQRFPAELRRDNQRLLLVHAWVLSLSAMRDDAADAIARVEELGHVEAGPLPDGFSSLESSLATLRGIFPWGDVGTALEHARRAAKLEDSQSPWWPAICWALGAGHYFGGDSAEADRWYTQTAELAPASEQWIVGVSALAYRSLIAGERGRLEEQASLAGDAVKLAREHGVDAVDGEVFVAAGQSLAARGKHDEALPLLERGVGVLRSFGQPLEFANALICHASVLRVVGETDGLRAVITEARATVDSCPDPGILEDRLAALERPAGSRPPTRGEDLSQRELAVLRMLRGPLSERDIGRELYLSHNTIHTHTKSIYRKLDVSSRAEAVARASERGLI